ncbi:MAG TPA: hypothetical protein VKT80_00650, partial [Chloroflexota bacterium]|nr:hypothetical protein [Chloroflexota bacterium]
MSARTTLAAPPAVTDLGRQLRLALGPQATIIDSPTELECYAYDASFESLMRPRLPDVVVQPRDVG